MLEIEGFEGQILENEPLSLHNTWKIGGKAKYVVFPTDEKDLEKVVSYAIKYSIPWYIVGNGSNILFPDEGIDGILIKMTKGFKNKAVIRYDDGKGIVFFGAGIISSEALSYLLKMEVSGLEFIAGIPGSIGGILKMNAGAFGKEIKDNLAWINLFSIKDGFITIERENLDFQYRKLKISEDYIITGGAFILERSISDIIRKNIENFQKIRKEKQPIGQPSCGSVFKNPEEIPAAKLIEEVGLKGFQVGGARVSDIHANFIINTGNATAKDILTLIELIKQKVWLKKGIMLEEEVVQINIKKQIKAKVI
jgi:UDP-N-acetylmuramate dehydrogenase